MKSIRYVTERDCPSDSPTEASSASAARESGRADILARIIDALCPICRRHIFSCNDAVVRLKTRIVIFENGTAYAKCKYCRNDVIVPLVMRESFDEEWLPVWNEARDGMARM